MNGVRALCAVLALAWCAPVRAGAVWLHGTNAWGGGGVYRVDSALAPTRGELAVSVLASGFTGSSMFKPTDTNTGFNAGVHVAYTPLVGLQLGLGGSYVLNSYTTFATNRVQSVGNPEAHVKVGFEVAPGYALGVVAHAALSTYSKSALSTAPVVARFLALGSAQPLPSLQVNVQAGYALDRSALGYSPAPEDPVRLGLGVSNGSHVDFGAAVVARIRPLFLAPFLEFSGAVPVRSLQPAWAAVITPGLRLDRAYGGIFEVGAGVDVRVAGVPHTGDSFAGVPAWRAFVLFALHGLTSQVGAVEWNQKDCSQDADCPAEAMCHQGICVQRPPPSPPPPQEVVYILHGVVRDSVTHRPVPNAHMTLQEFPQAPLRTGDDGAFASFPLPDDGKPVTFVVRAYGYVDRRLEVLAQGQAVEVELTPEAQADTGIIHVLVHDGHLGTVVVGAKVAAGNKTAVSDAQGECTLHVAPGMAHVVTTADRYVSQHSQIEIQAGATFILNIDLMPRHRHKR